VNDVDLRDDTDVTAENDLKDTDSSDTVKVDLYIANAGKQERSGGPYLDDVERHNAETWRAQRENREPDYENPPLTAGTVLVPKSQLVERDTDKSHFSDNVEITQKPYTTLEVDVSQGEPDPAQPDFDNNYDRLKAFQAKEQLDAVSGDTSKQADSQGPVAESVTSESKLNSDASSEDVGDDVNPGNAWDVNGPNSTGDEKV